jgi:penicillin-binding protein 1A
MRKLFAYLLKDSPSETITFWTTLTWRFLFIGFGMAFLIFIFLSFSELPSVKELENPNNELASQIFSTNGTSLGNFYVENRVPVTFSALPPHLVNALLATEDERFYMHNGIDFEALGRVMIKTIVLRQESSGGASTLTQQLAKQLFTKNPSTNKVERIVQKLKEWIIAVRLERNFTKEEIIALYLNKFSFINGAYGIKAASEIYFGKSQEELTVPEAATLVGMLQNPSLYNPLRRPERVIKRREVVLKQMTKRGFLTEEEYEKYRTQDLGINFKPRTHIDGIATYYRMELAKQVKEILSKSEHFKSGNQPYDIYKDGLKIYTTIDADMQKLAEESMIEHMALVQKNFQREWGKTDPWTYKSNSKLEISVATRQKTLIRLMRETESYQIIRDKYLGDILPQISKKYDVRFPENDILIDFLMEEVKQPGTLLKRVNAGLSRKEDVNTYLSILRDPLFNTLRRQWNLMQEQVKQHFNTPVSMRVFTYEKRNIPQISEKDRWEKDTMMSPLDSIKYHRQFLQTGILGVDPRTGHVKFWVGGINHKYFQYDHVDINRQVGSSFKPFVYATAIAAQGLSPCFQVQDVATTIAAAEGQFGLIEDWTPNNFDNKYTGEMLTLKEGLKKSTNTVSTFLMKTIGNVEPVRGLIHNMGIDSSSRRNGTGELRVPKSPSICLGAADLSVMEMTGAYTTFANNGVFNRPLHILRIEDKNGKLIYEGYPEEKRAIPSDPNYVMVEMLKYAGGMGGLKSEAGGKTGTTNDFVDGWFMGITPGLVIGTWVGAEDKWVHFRTSYNGQGARMAKPFFVSFMKKLEEMKNIDYDPSLRFLKPSGEFSIEMDCNIVNNANRVNSSTVENEFVEEEF